MTAPVLTSVAASTMGGGAASVISHRVTMGSWDSADKAGLTKGYQYLYNVWLM